MTRRTEGGIITADPGTAITEARMKAGTGTAGIREKGTMSL